MRSMPAQHGFTRTQWILAALLAILAAWYWLPELRWRLHRGAAPEPRPVLARGDLAEDERMTIEIFENARGSVVFIATREHVIDFWTRNVHSVPSGTGSGFIWDERGHVVTNLHVIAGASEASVRLNDGRNYPAVLVGASPTHDLAVLRIRVPMNLPVPIPIGTSHDLQVGQKVFAIGNPFGLDWTLTTGIVSALDRSFTGQDGHTLQHLIQTDAAINPGNSGGPLLDSAGRLIGVNTAIYSPSGANAGVGFAIPVDTVNRVVPQLIANGRYIQPSLGIQVDDTLNRLITRQLGVRGVAVLRVSEGSAAARAGLRGARLTVDRSIIPGDVITAVNDRPVESTGQLLATLDDYQIGDVVTLSVWREGRIIKLQVKLQAGE
jgi:S1-C subfamily serine protease